MLKPLDPLAFSPGFSLLPFRVLLSQPWSSLCRAWPRVWVGHGVSRRLQLALRTLPPPCGRARHVSVSVFRWEDVCVASTSGSRAAVNAPVGTRVRAVGGGLPRARGDALCRWPGVISLPRSSQNGALASPRCPQFLGFQLSGCCAARHSPGGGGVGQFRPAVPWLPAASSFLCCWSSVGLGDMSVQGLCPFPYLHHWVVCC